MTSWTRTCGITDFDGNVIWTRQFGSGVFDLVIGIGTDGSHVYLSGDTSCSVQDADIALSEGSRERFVAQLAINPTVLSGKL